MRSLIVDREHLAARPEAHPYTTRNRRRAPYGPHPRPTHCGELRNRGADGGGCADGHPGPSVPGVAMFSVRIHGRGGQGVVTAAELLSLAAFDAGVEAQAFPSFGSERTGAPVVSFCRLEDRPIRVGEVSAAT